MATDDGNRKDAAELFTKVEGLLEADGVTPEDRLCYQARVVGQRAFHLTKPLPGEKPKLEEAQALFERLEEDPTVPFACFRRSSGLAYCTWKLGDPHAGAELARVAADYAGDAGFVRFRIMALNMLSQMVGPEEGRLLNQRAARLARQLEDEDLLRRVHHRAKKLNR